MIYYIEIFSKEDIKIWKEIKMSKTTEEINELKKLKMHESFSPIGSKVYVMRVPKGLWYMFDNRSIFVPFDNFNEKDEE